MGQCISDTDDEKRLLRHKPQYIERSLPPRVTYLLAFKAVRYGTYDTYTELHAILWLQVKLLYNEIYNCGEGSMSVKNVGLLAASTKYRSNKALVLGVQFAGKPSIVTKALDECRVRGLKRLSSLYDNTFSYKLGHVATALRDSSSNIIKNGCGHGIHFFTDIESAISYGYAGKNSGVYPVITPPICDINVYPSPVAVETKINICPTPGVVEGKTEICENQGDFIWPFVGSRTEFKFNSDPATLVRTFKGHRITDFRHPRCATPEIRHSDYTYTSPSAPKIAGVLPSAPPSPAIKFNGTSVPSAPRLADYQSNSERNVPELAVRVDEGGDQIGTIGESNGYKGEANAPEDISQMLLNAPEVPVNIPGEPGAVVGEPDPVAAEPNGYKGEPVPSDIPGEPEAEVKEPIHIPGDGSSAVRRVLLDAPGVSEDIPGDPRHRLSKTRINQVPM